MKFSTKTITTCAVLAALALALSYLEAFSRRFCRCPV